MQDAIICSKQDSYERHNITKTWFGLVSLVSGTSLFMGNLMPKPFLSEISWGTLVGGRMCSYLSQGY